MYEISVDKDGKVSFKKLQREKNIRKKGVSKLEVIDSYVIIDIETTGLDPRFDDIIEVSAIKILGNKIEETFTSLVKIDYEIPDFVTNLTGITNELLFCKGKELETVLTEFNEFVSDQIILGYNVNFDINFIYDNMYNLFNKEFKNDFIDVMRMCRMTHKELKHHRLIDMLNFYNISNNQEHRSLSDCIQTKEVYDKVKFEFLEYIKNNPIAKSYSEILNAKNINITVENIPQNHMFYNKNIAFTGKLDNYKRKDCMQLVKNLGSEPQNNVTSTTNFLIIGDTNYSNNVKAGVTSKMRKAYMLKEKGQDIEILTETMFVSMVNEILEDKE